MSDLTTNESNITEYDEEEVTVGTPGFMRPEVRAKAMERSLATRRGEVLVKSGEFLPSKSMMIILKVALDLDSGDSVRGWFAKAGLSRSLWFDWQKNPQFSTWWKKEFAEGVKQYESKWVLIGLKKMNKDFRYWNEVGKKIFGFIDKIAIKEEKSPEEAALYSELVDVIRSYKGTVQLSNAQKSDPIDITPSVEDLEESLSHDLKEG